MEAWVWWLGEVRLLTINAVWGIRPAWLISSWFPREPAICWVIVAAWERGG